jgi:hypothetical protein
MWLVDALTSANRRVRAFDDSLTHFSSCTVFPSAAQGTVKRYKAYKPWAKGVASKPRPKDPLKPCKRRKAETDAEQDLALQIRHATFVFYYQL